MRTAPAPAPALLCATASRRAGVVVALAAGALVALLAVAGWELRLRPCPGHVTPQRLEEVARRFDTLRVVPRDSFSQSQQEGCMVSYPTSGETIQAFGPLVLTESWTQSGNDAHPMGRFMRISVAPRDESESPGPPWAQPLYDGPAGPELAVQVRQDEGVAGAYVVQAPAFMSEPTWAPFRVTIDEQRSVLTFATVVHEHGHRRLPDALSLWLGFLFAFGGLALAGLARSDARRLAWREATVADDGSLVPDDGGERIAAPSPALPPGSRVLFETPQAAQEPYRGSAVSRATSVWPQARKVLQKRVGAMLVAALVAVVLAVVCAVDLGV